MRQEEKLSEALRTSGIGCWQEEIYRVVYIRAGFRCEYCGYDLISDFRAYYAFWHLDHILPKSVYQNLGGPTYYKYTQTCTEFRNLALACCACNKLKGEYDVGAEIVAPGVNDIDEKQREELLVRARSYIDGQRQAPTDDHQRFCSLLQLVSKPVAEVCDLGRGRSVRSKMPRVTASSGLAEAGYKPKTCFETSSKRIPRALTVQR